MRVLLSIHHRLDRDAGAPGSALRLAAALRDLGVDVKLCSYDDAFSDSGPERVLHSLRFPLKVATHLWRHGGDYEVLDTSTGDAWAWSLLRRPSHLALVTRSHGLEQLADRAVRAAAARGEVSLSRRYPLYHGGLRLRLVARSLQAADACVLLNVAERESAERDLGIAPKRLHVLPNGVGEEFLNLPDVEAEYGAVPLRLAFIGRWTDAKGSDVIVGALERLGELGVEATLTILGPGIEPQAVAKSMPPSAQAGLTVVPRFANSTLPELLTGQHVILLPSRSEGFSIALLEAMACGLAPLATPVGGAPALISNGENGLLVERSPASLTTALVKLASDRPYLMSMRQHAQQTARGYGWNRIAERTLGVYEAAVRRRTLTRP